MSSGVGSTSVVPPRSRISLAFATVGVQFPRDLRRRQRRGCATRPTHGRGLANTCPTASLQRRTCCQTVRSNEPGSRLPRSSSAERRAVTPGPADLDEAMIRGARTQRAEEITMSQAADKAVDQHLVTDEAVAEPIAAVR